MEPKIFYNGIEYNGTNKYRAAELCNRIVREELGRLNYKFEFSNTHRAIGDCSYGLKRIRISWKFWIINDWDTMYGILLHEIAHALTYAAVGHRGHGAAFKYTCDLIGVPIEHRGCYTTKIISPKRR